MLSPNSLFERLGTKPKLDPQPFSGWALELACRIDTACPSFLAHTFNASNLMRQSIFAALAELDTTSPDDLAARLRAIAPAECITTPDPLAQIGRARIIAKARDIIGAVYATVPDGMLGVMARVGADPFREPGGYRDLFRMLTEPQHRGRAKVLMQIEGKISPIKIEVLMRLDPVLVHKNVLGCLFEVKVVDDLHVLLDLIRTCCSGATDDAIRRSLDQIRTSTDLPKWAQSWLIKMDRAPPVTLPLPVDDPDFVLAYGERLSSLGRRLRNCATTKVGSVAVGKSLLYEWVKPPGAVVELRRLSDGRWLLMDILGDANSRPPSDLASTIRDKLMSHGVLTFGAPHPSPISGGMSRLLYSFDRQEDWSDDLEALEEHTPGEAQLA
jgi:hypothetical protein